MPRGCGPYVAGGGKLKGPVTGREEATDCRPRGTPATRCHSPELATRTSRRLGWVRVGGDAAGVVCPPLTIGMRGHRTSFRSPTPPTIAFLEGCVATYEYRCEDCGGFEQRMAMGTATASVACPTCGRDAKRVFSVPMTSRTPRPLATMLAREEASRDYPEVVDRLPPRQRPRRSAPPNPALARLPKP